MLLPEIHNISLEIGPKNANKCEIDKLWMLYEGTSGSAKKKMK